MNVTNAGHRRWKVGVVIRYQYARQYKLHCGHKGYYRHTHLNLLHVSNGPLEISICTSGNFGGVSAAGDLALVIVSSREIDIIFEQLFLFFRHSGPSGSSKVPLNRDKRRSLPRNPRICLVLTAAGSPGLHGEGQLWVQ
jgi:hypothetical protein